MFTETIDFTYPELLSKEDLFKRKFEENATSTMLFRFVGFFLAMFGTALLFSPIIALVAWIPLVGFLIAHGVSLVVWIFAFVLAATTSLLTIALAWLYYRPLYGALLLTAVGAGVALMFLV